MYDIISTDLSNKDAATIAIVVAAVIYGLELCKLILETETNFIHSMLKGNYFSAQHLLLDRGLQLLQGAEGRRSRQQPGQGYGCKSLSLAQICTLCTRKFYAT